MSVFTDSKHEALLNWTLGVLQGIETGVTPPLAVSSYWYTPTVVRGVPILDYFDKARALNIQTLYLLWSGDDERDINHTTGSVDKVMDLQLVLARQSGIERRTGATLPGLADMGEGASTQPFDPFATILVGQHPDVYRSRMLQDVDKALRADPTFGGVAMGWQLLEPHRNRAYYVDGWDACHVPIQISYRHLRMDP